MLSKTIQNLQHFVGRVCSILTVPVNRQFDELRAREHFVVRVGEITSDGVWGTHPANGMVSFFPIEHIVSIAEEIELDVNNPEHAQMIQEYEKKTGKKIESDIGHKPPKREKVLEPEEEQAPFVDINNLEALAAQTRQQYSQQPKQDPSFVDINSLTENKLP